MRALVQIRGEVNQSGAVEDTLEMLNLGRVNHATFVPETDAYEGMVTKVNDWVAHGEPSADTVATVLRSRGEPAEGSADLTDEFVAEGTDYDDVDAPAAGAAAASATGPGPAGSSPRRPAPPPARPRRRSRSPRRRTRR
jgi:large subunit ribosomal protein L30